MTPREKAKKLVEKIKDYAHKPQSYLIYAKRDEADWLSNAKQCALIAVEFALTGLIQTDDEELINYYRKVKEEIEKL